MNLPRNNWTQRLMLGAVELGPYAALACAQPGGSVSALLAWVVGHAVLSRGTPLLKAAGSPRGSVEALRVAG